MTYAALATDYDGTIAQDGQVSEATLDALRRLKQAGLRLVLVTGRQSSDLLTTFGHLSIFDRAVVENGAAIFHPERESVETLAPPPPPRLLEYLAREGVPLSVGRSIVATGQQYEQAVRRAIRGLGLEWHVILNKGAVMALPATVTKATGLAQALAALGVRAEQTVGVGDAENDRELLQMCGLAVAVENALPAVKAIADVVTKGARGDGVIELVDALLSGRLAGPFVEDRQQR